MQPTYRQQSKTKLVAGIIAIIVIAGIVLISDHVKSTNSTITATTTTTQPASTTSNTSTTTTTTPSSSADDSSLTSSTSSSYKDGTYTATSDYYVPHGTESIKVSLTLSNEVITASSITNSESDRDSQAYQEDFASSYKTYVVGKNISGLQLSTISGASDTTQGFQDALTKIASEAKA